MALANPPNHGTRPLKSAMYPLPYTLPASAVPVKGAETEKMQETQPVNGGVYMVPPYMTVAAIG